jgi:hypothetical protein
MDHLPQLRMLRERLAESRTRLDRARALGLASRVGLFSASLLLALRLGAYLAPRWAVPSHLVGSAAYAIAGAVLLAGLAWSIVYVRRTSPSLEEVARLADRHFGMDERWSTAVEFGVGEVSGTRVGEAAGESPSPVLSALLEDAASHTRLLDPRELAPIRTPRTVWVMVAMLLAVTALEVAPVSSAAPAPVAAGSSPAAADDPATTADLLLQTAALLRQEAESRQNEYMRVVASAMEALALEITERGLGGDALSAELARLVAHAELALGGPVVESAAGRATAAASAESLEWQGGAEPADPSAGSARDEEPGGRSSTAMAQGGGMTMENDARIALQNLQNRLSGDSPGGERLAGDPSGSSPEAMEAASDPSQLGASGSDDGESERMLANLLLEADAAGEGSIGDGGSQQQGIGGGAMAGIPDRAELQQAASSRDFHLPTEGGSRRRMPNEIVPETRLAPVEETGVDRGSWSSTTEPRVSQELLGISYRSIASRYFLSRSEEAAEAAP